MAYLLLVLLLVAMVGVTSAAPITAPGTDGEDGVELILLANAGE